MGQDMGIEASFFITLLLLGLVVRSTNAANKSTYDDINRASFPEGFLFGTASSAYQVIINLLSLIISPMFKF